MTRRRARGPWLALVLLAAGCAGGARDPATIADAEVAALRDAILALPGPGDSAEATAIARRALGGVARLAARYRMTWPPLLHNNLVHLGLRPRGLCCHWSEDLLHELEALPLVHYQSFWLTSYLGNRWREHNTPAIAPIGNDWTQSLILDGWRKSGVLVYARAAGDRYPWQLHPLDARRDILRCLQN